MLLAVPVLTLSLLKTQSYNNYQHVISSFAFLQISVWAPICSVWFVQNWHSPSVRADLKLEKFVSISMAGTPGLLVVFKCGVKGNSCKIY